MRNIPPRGVYLLKHSKRRRIKLQHDYKAPPAYQRWTPNADDYLWLGFASLNALLVFSLTFLLSIAECGINLASIIFMMPSSALLIWNGKVWYQLHRKTLTTQHSRAYFSQVHIYFFWFAIIVYWLIFFALIDGTITCRPINKNLPLVSTF